MRPVRRGDSPQTADFAKYTDAFPELASRLGFYCSYCERRISTGLAVEHLQPKALSQYAHLVGCWTNFLLGCTNCNSTKSKKDVVFANLLFPDRDNTFVAFEYRPDGKVVPSAQVSDAVKGLAEETLRLTGLDKRISKVKDSNGKLVAIDRVAQRMEAWAIAEESLKGLLKSPNNPVMLSTVCNLAKAQGFFSVWMTVFKDHPDYKKALIDAFPGTRESGCFDPATSDPVSPAPNPDGLADGGKI